MKWLAAPLLLLLAAAPARGDTVRFLVTELPGQSFHGDSYVLPISDPGAIAHARELVKQGTAAGATIAIARIAPGADGVNRDWLAPGAPPWSWHVTELIGYGDVSIEIYDGWPGYVESDVAGWIANTRGVIGFWNYTVTLELETIPEPSSLVLASLGLAALARRARRRGCVG